MNNKVVYALYQTFQRRGFSVLRFNFRGVGRSQGRFDRGEGELSDAASALDWLQAHNPNATACWVAGFSFGAWIGMQLLMRRPEITSFISISPPANMYDFSFLAPCPSSGLVIQGDEDDIVPAESVNKLVQKLSQPAGHHDRLPPGGGRQPFLPRPAGRVDGRDRRLSRRPQAQAREGGGKVVLHVPSPERHPLRGGRSPSPRKRGEGIIREHHP